MRRGATLLSLVAALACSRSPSTPPAPSGPVTTDGLLARSNLESMIGGREGMLARDPASGSVRLALVTLLQARASTYGRVEDLERAEELGEQAVARAPRSPEAWLARAASRSALHRFREASADLDRAQALGRELDAIAAQRASFALATGRLTTALTLVQARAEREPGMATLSTLGVALAESGDGPGATRAFARALGSYRDTSPFPVAFIEFQEGLLDERAGDLASAANHYRSVIERLPGHAQAAVHLAGIEIALGRLDAADAALGTLMAEASDPEIPATRAALARRRGDLATAAREEALARGRYHVLLEHHPDAFADHAARFFLDREPAEALRWAVHNLGARQTAEAYDLALTAALRAGDRRARCDIARRAGGVSGGTARLGILVSDALAVCERAS